MNLDDRKQAVLRTIIALYTEGGEPVGSNLLSQRLGLALSSATLRNEMAALTRAGFLIQPHTSAGRVPSLNGYRYYIENLLQSPALPMATKAHIDETLLALSYDKERMVQSAAGALAELCGLPAVATTPHHPDSSIAHYEVLQVGRYTACILGIGHQGEVSTRVASTRTPLTSKGVGALAGALNAKLTFVPAAAITRQKLAEVIRDLGEGAAALAPLVNAAVQLVQGLQVPRVYVEGREHLLDYEELDQDLKGIIALFGDRVNLQSLLSRKGETYFIWGDEIAQYYLPALCMVVAPYFASGGLGGTLALAGPARMNYTKLVPVLQYFAKTLGGHLAATGKED